MAQDAVTPLRKTPRLAVVEGSGYVRAARSQLQAGEVALVGAGLVILSYSQSKHSVISNKRMWCSTTT